jgi:serine/threonine protein kinase
MVARRGIIRIFRFDGHRSRDSPRSVHNPCATRLRRHGRGLSRPRPRLGRDIAVKLIRAAAADRDDALDRLREATLASALNHPNIVTIYETGVTARDR